MQPQNETPPTHSPKASADQPAPLLTPSSRRSKLLTILAVLLTLAALVTAAIVFMQSSALDKESEETAPVGQVTISSDQGFSPATIKVKRGQTVVWTNNDSIPHKIETTEDEANAVLRDFGMADAVGVGEQYSYTFETVGTFTYNDPDNPFATVGTVTVEE